MKADINFKLSESQKLKLLFAFIYSKVRSIQIDNNFDIAIEREARKTYIGMNDSYFFQQMCDVIFQSGVRGAVWQKYEREIRKEFADYNVEKVAKYTKKHVERMLHNPKMLKNKRKIEACIHNAKQIVQISRKCKGFWHWLANNNNIEELVEKLKGNFKFMGYTNAYAFLRYVGVECVKPDLNVVRVLFRLGLIDSDKRNVETYKQIQDVGKKMADANGVRVAVVDYVLYFFGSGEKPFVKYAVCGVKPRCEECSLKSHCKHNKENESNYNEETKNQKKRNL